MHYQEGSKEKKGMHWRDQKKRKECTKVREQLPVVVLYKGNFFSTGNSPVVMASSSCKSPARMALPCVQTALHPPPTKPANPNCNLALASAPSCLELASLTGGSPCMAISRMGMESPSRTTNSPVPLASFPCPYWTRQPHWRFRHAWGVASQTGEFQAGGRRLGF